MELSPSFERAGLYCDQWHAFNQQVLDLWTKAQSVKVARQLETFKDCRCCDALYMNAHCEACRPSHEDDWARLRKADACPNCC